MMHFARLAAFLLLSVFLTQPLYAQIIPGLSTTTSEDTTAEEETAQTAATQVDALLQLLSNPGVLEELTQRLSAAEQNSTPDASQPAPIPEAQISVGRQIANITTSVAEDLARSLDSLSLGMSHLPTVLERSLAAFDELVLMAALSELLFVVLMTYAVFLTLRFFGRRLDTRIARRVNDSHAALLFGYALLAAFKDMFIVLVAWAVGYGLQIAFVRGATGVGDTQALYLNAFLLVEISKITIRTVLSPRMATLRLVHLPDRGARILARWLTTCTSLLGYGLMLVVPLVNANASVLAGSAFGTVLSIAVVLSALVMLAIHHRNITNWMLPVAEGGRSLVHSFVALWPLPVAVYLLGLLAIVATRPGGVLIPLLRSTGLILGTVLVAMMAVQLLTGAIARGVSLPDSWKMRFPLLEGRLNSFVPRVLKALRTVMFIVVFAVILDVFGLFDAVYWLSTDTGALVLTSAVSVILITTVAFAMWLVLSSWVEFRLNPDFGRPATAREKTLLTLLRNAATIALLIITIMIVLSELGLNIGPLLASAGVLGLAIGFGAQKMVQDIITGVFIQFENAINVGDVIEVGGITGAVERLTVRSVSLRDVHGVFHIIPFSSVDLVSNYMREFSYFVCDMGIAYRENIDDAREAMFECFAELKKSDHGRNILGDLEWFGLNSFGDSAIVLRARIKTIPGEQWGIGRAYNLILKRVFDEREIEIPFPHQTIYFGEDKQGKAPPMRVLREVVEHARTGESADHPAAQVTPETDPHKAMPESDDAPSGDDAPR